MTADPTGASQFHLTRDHTVAALGRVATLAGAGVLVVVSVPALTGPGLLATVLAVVGWAMLVPGVVLTALAAARLLRPPVIVRLDDDGFEVRVLRGGGPRAVEWSRVRQVRRETLRPGPCVVVELGAGERTVVPEHLVAEGGASLVAALRSHLDVAHGQRPVTTADLDEARRREQADGGDGVSGGGGGGI